MKKPKKLPKYPDGGLHEFGKNLKNTGLFIADNALVEWAPNAITQDQYADTGFGRELGNATSVNESLSSNSPIRKYVSKYWTDGKETGMNSQQTDWYNKAMPIGQTGSTIGGIFAGNGLSKVGGAGQVAKSAVEYPMGGVTGPNAELEKQENTLNPDGSTTQFNGPGHEQGGIPTQLDPGTLVFSDRLKKGGKTFADLNKPNNTSKEDKILGDDKANKLSKATAQLMKDAKNRKSLELFNEQESMKANKADKYIKRMGGIQKYAYGGEDPVRNSTLNPDMVLLQDMQTNDYPNPSFDRPVDNFPKMDDYNELPTMYSPTIGKMANGTLDSMEDPYPNPQLTPSKQTLKQRTAGRIPAQQTGYNSSGSNPYLAAGSALISNLGAFYDLKRAKEPIVEKYDRMTASLLDPTADLKYNNLQAKIGQQNIKSASVGNSSTYIQNVKDLTLGTQMNATRIAQQYANANAQIKNHVNQYNNQLSKEEVIAKIANDARNRDLKRSALGQIGSSAAEAGMGYNRDVNAEKRDQDFMNMIAARYPEIMKDPAMKEYFNRNRKSTK